MIRRIRAAESFQQLAEIFAGSDIAAIEVRSVIAAARKLDALDKPQPAVRVAMIGTHTMEPLPDFLKVAAAAAGQAIECWQAPYGQYMQAVTSSADDLRRFDPDIVLLSAELRSLSPQLARDFISLTASEAEEERRRLVAHLLEWAELACAATRATVLVSNCPRPPRVSLGIADLKRVPGETEFYLRLNLELIDAVRASERITVFDLDAAVAACGSERAWSHRMYFLAKQPWQPALVGIVAREVWRHISAAKGWARKCLVLDLDNTLWGGVVGEDGPAGLKIGAGDPDGEAYAEFQHAIRELKARGVILAVASKNNVDDVNEAFEQRPEMPLRKDDFAVMEIGWHDKAQSVERIAATLDIGLDSLVFLDDNPAERAQVGGSLPSVLVPELPNDPSLYAEFLRRQAWFERSRITAEDIGKTRQYVEQAARVALRTSAASLSTYLMTLGTEMHIWRARTENLARVHQLFSKTNQFNVTTRRYELGDVDSFIGSGQHSLWIASATDRFGDLGIIGLCLLEHAGDDVLIDSFLMSCRALGRGIETALMNAIKQEVSLGRGSGKLRARFVPTRKNAPASGFFESQGLKVVASSPAGVLEFELALDELTTIPVPHIRVTCTHPS